MEHFFHPKNVKTPGKHQQANKAHHKATKQKSLRLHIPISSAPRRDSVAPLTIRQYHSIGFMPTYRVRPWQVESVRPKTICDNASRLGTTSYQADLESISHPHDFFQRRSYNPYSGLGHPSVVNGSILDGRSCAHRPPHVVGGHLLTFF